VSTRLYDDVTVSVFTARRSFDASVDHSTLLHDKNQVCVFPFQYQGPKQRPEAADGAGPSETLEEPAPAKPDTAEDPQPAAPSPAEA